jgi:hypothetical protein
MKEATSGGTQKNAGHRPMQAFPVVKIAADDIRAPIVRKASAFADEESRVRTRTFQPRRSSAAAAAAPT